MRLAICRRISYRPLLPKTKPKTSECRFYAASLPPHHWDESRLEATIREHWGIENRLHHVKDRTWLEDRHWVGNKRTGEMVTLLRSLSVSLLRKAEFPGLRREAYSPERIEYFQAHPQRAVELLKGAAGL